MTRDLDNDTLTISAVNHNGTLQGIISISEDGRVLLYTPPRGIPIVERTTFEVTDGYDSAMGWVHLNVRNDPPQANDDSFLLIKKDEIRQLDVLRNDFDPNDDPIEISDVFNVCAAANVFFNATVINFVPSRSESLLAPKPPYARFGCSMQYTINDGSDYSTANVYITLENKLPTMDSLESVQLYKNQPNITLLIAHSKALPHIQNLMEDVKVIVFDDADEYDSPTVHVSAFPRQHNDKDGIAFTALGSNDERKRYLDTGTYRVFYHYYRLVISPLHNTVYSDSVHLQVNDGFDTTTAIVAFSVSNTRPEVQDHFFFDCSKNNQAQYDVVTGGYDKNGDRLRIQPGFNVSTTLGGVAYVNEDDPRYVVYNPPTGVLGVDSFTVHISDIMDNLPENALEASSQIEINILNDNPIAVPDSAEVMSGGEIVDIYVLQNDKDPNHDENTLKINSITETALHSNGSHIEIRVDNNGVDFIRFNSSDLRKNDSFSYTIRDIDGGVSEPAVVSITVLNAPPVAISDDFEMHWLNTFDARVLENDVDINKNDPKVDWKIESIDCSTAPQLTCTKSDPTIKINVKDTENPDLSILSTHRISYRMTDGQGGISNWANVDITVTNHHGPEPKNVSYQYHHCCEFYLDIVANERNDKDGDPILLDTNFELSSEKLILSYTADKRIRCKPKIGFVGEDTFKFQVTDKLASAAAFVHVTILNTPPEAVNDLIEMHWRTAITLSNITYNVLNNDKEYDDEDKITVYSTKLSQGPAGTSVFHNDSSVTVSLPPLIRAPIEWQNDPSKRVVSVRYSIFDQAEWDHADFNITITNEHKPSPIQVQSAVHWRSVFNQKHGLTIDPIFDMFPLDNDGDLIYVDGGSAQTKIQNSAIEVDYIIDTANSNRTLLIFKTAEPYSNPYGDVVEADICDGLDCAKLEWTVKTWNNPPTAGEPIEVEIGRFDFNTSLHINLIELCSDPDHADLEFLKIVECRKVSGESTEIKLTATDTGCIVNVQSFVGLDNLVYTVTDGLANSTASGSIVLNATQSGLFRITFTEHWRNLIHGKEFSPLEAIREFEDASLMEVLQQPGHGKVEIVDDSTFNYTFTPPDPLELKRQEFILSTERHNLSMSIHVTNTKPICSPITTARHWRVLQQDGIKFPLQQLAFDPNRDPITLQQRQDIPPSHGQVNVQKFDEISYTLSKPMRGYDCFSFGACDGIESCSALVNISITNSPPRVTQSIHGSYHWRALTSDSVVINPLDPSISSDPDFDPIHVSSHTALNDTFAQLALIDEKLFLLSSADTTMAAQSVNRTVSFSFSISDTVDSTQSTVYLSFTNKAPIAVDDCNANARIIVYAYERITGGKDLTDILQNDFDPDLEDMEFLTVENVSQPDSGEVLILPNGTILYIPDKNTGLHTNTNFTYYVSDGAELSQKPATVFLKVISNHPTAKDALIEMSWNSTNPKSDVLQLADEACKNNDRVSDFRTNFRMPLRIGNSYGTLHNEGDGSVSFEIKLEDIRQASWIDDIAETTYRFRCYDLANVESLEEAELKVQIRASVPKSEKISITVDPRTNPVEPISIHIFKYVDAEQLGTPVLLESAVLTDSSLGTVNSNATHVTFIPYPDSILRDVEIVYSLSNDIRKSSNIVSIKYVNYVPRCTQIPTFDDVLPKGKSMDIDINDFLFEDDNGDEISLVDIVDQTSEIATFTLNATAKLITVTANQNSGNAKAILRLFDGYEIGSCELSVPVGNRKPSASPIDQTVVRKLHGATYTFDLISLLLQKNAKPDPDGDDVELHSVTLNCVNSSVSILNDKVRPSFYVEAVVMVYIYIANHNLYFIPTQRTIEFKASTLAHAYTCVVDYIIVDKDPQDPLQSEPSNFTLTFEDRPPSLCVESLTFTLTQGELKFFDISQILYCFEDENGDSISFDQDSLSNGDACGNGLDKYCKYGTPHISESVLSYHANSESCNTDYFRVYAVDSSGQRSVNFVEVTIKMEGCFCNLNMLQLFVVDSSTFISGKQWDDLKVLFTASLMLLYNICTSFVCSID